MTKNNGNMNIKFCMILNINYFYKISLFVELIILALICYFLIFSYSYHTSLLVYIGYQLTFVFGSYLVRAETLILKNSKILTYIDVAKQTGSLVGMGIAFIFYQVFEHNLDINGNEDQVYYIHYLLLLIEILIICKLRDSFQKS